MRTNRPRTAWIIVLLSAAAACGYAQGPRPEPAQPPPPPGMMPGGMPPRPGTGPGGGGGPVMGMPGPEGMFPMGEMGGGMMGMGMPFMGPGMGPGNEDFRRREQLVIEVLGRLNPMEVKELEKLRLVNAGAYMERIEERWPEARELDDLRRRDPHRFEEMVKIHRAESESRQLAQKARNLQGESRARALEEIDRVLVRIFDFKQEQREREVEHLSKELERLRESLGRRAEHREEIIARRKGELLGEIEPLEW